jgi:hypothetical protein
MIFSENRRPLFQDHAQAIEKPRTFSGGASVQMMRPNFYARTTPKARGGCLVFVVVLKVVIIGAGP